MPSCVIIDKKIYSIECLTKNMHVVYKCLHYCYWYLYDNIYGVKISTARRKKNISNVSGGLQHIPPLVNDKILIVFENDASWKIPMVKMEKLQDRAYFPVYEQPYYSFFKDTLSKVLSKLYKQIANEK